MIITLVVEIQPGRIDLFCIVSTSYTYSFSRLGMINTSCQGTMNFSVKRFCNALLISFLTVFVISRYTLRNVGGGWVKKVAMDHKLAHLYCCSETDLHAYNLNSGDEIFSIKRYVVRPSQQAAFIKNLSYCQLFCLVCAH